MELKDFVVTPIVLMLIFLSAYWLRPFLTNPATRRYFIPALTFKIIGAICIGFIYQFYYDRGGDTFAYFNQGKEIHRAFYTNPVTGIKLLSYTGGDYRGLTDNNPETFEYTSKMRFFVGKSEYFVVRAVGFLGLFCFHTYTSIAALFAYFSFFGLWVAYFAFTRIFNNLALEFAIAFLFIPSVVLWGSGVMKDSITISSIGWIVAAVYWIIYRRKYFILSLIIILLSVYVIYVVKIYVLFALIPSILLWLVLHFRSSIKINLVRRMITPVFISLSLIAGYSILINISKGDKRYDITQVGERTKINADYLYYVSQRNKGSGYNLGELDGSVESMLNLVPKAINVSLFRPYLWEVQNPLMFLSFLESTFFLLITLSLLIRPGIIKSFKYIMSDNVLIFCFLFALILAAAVGLNSYNFGTLSRYKIILLPFYLSGVFILRNYSKIIASSTK